VTHPTARRLAKHIFRGTRSAIGTAAIIVATWEVLRTFGPGMSGLLPSAGAIGRAAWSLAFQAEFVSAAGATLLRSGAGLGLSILLAIPIGLLLGASRSVREIFAPVFDALRSVPVTSMYPAVVVILGIGERAKIGMVTLGCVPILVLHFAAAIAARSQIRHSVARLFGASSVALVRDVDIYESAHDVLTGLRVAVGYAFIVTAVTELFMGADVGIGQSLMEAYSIYDLPRMFAYIFYLALTGWLLNRILVTGEAITARWRGVAA
jgi:ABC-type nitrate/sulfonate/bicarbonate transport system permease component